MIIHCTYFHIMLVFGIFSGLEFIGILLLLPVLGTLVGMKAACEFAAATETTAVDVEISDDYYLFCIKF